MVMVAVVVVVVAVGCADGADPPAGGCLPILAQTPISPARARYAIIGGHEVGKRNGESRHHINS